MKEVNVENGIINTVGDQNKENSVVNAESNDRVIILAKKWYNELTDDQKQEIFDVDTYNILVGDNLPDTVKDIIIKNKYLETDTGDELDMFNKFRYNFEYKLKSKSGAFSGYLPKTKDISKDKFVIQHESRNFSFMVTKNNTKFWLSLIVNNKAIKIFDIIDQSAVDTILAVYNANENFKAGNGKTFKTK